MQSTPPVHNIQGNRGSSPRICKELPPSPLDPPKQEEILEFARIIGIDADAEPHLLYLAREGLVAPLPPNWKPCFDPAKNAYFYFDTGSKHTQWQHPLNAVYAQKVLAARNMNSNSELKPRATLKDFPPLRKASAILSSQDGVNDLKDPLGLIKAPLPPANRLAPLKPIGKLQPIQGLKPLAQAQPHVKAPLGLEEGRKLVPPSWIPDEDPPSIAGSGGDSLRKVSSEESISGFGHSIEKPKVIAQAQTPKSGHATIGASVGSAQNFPPRHIDPSVVRKLFPDDPKLNTVKGPIKAKGNVAFNLEDEIDLKFETSSQGSSVKDRSSEETSNGDESEDMSEEVDLEPVTPVTIARRPVSTQPTIHSNVTVRPAPSATAVVRTVAAQAIPVQEKGAGESVSEKKPISTKADEDALRLKMEKDLEEFRLKLVQERVEREAALKTEMNAALEAIRAANAQKVNQENEAMRKELEASLEKFKNENAKRLASELEALKTESEKLMQQSRDETLRKNEQTLKEVSSDIQMLDKELLLAEHKKKFFESIEDEAKIRSEEFRKSLQDQQKAEIDRLKASHQQLLENLKKEWSDEETKLRGAQRLALEELQQTFKAERAGAIARQKETELPTPTTNQMLPPLTPPRSIRQSSELDEKERELFRTKRKYKLLQHKYTALKDEISNLPPPPPEEPETLSITESYMNNSLDGHPPITSDRLGRALGALEILREQILDMNPSQEPLTSVRPPETANQQPPIPERRSSHPSTTSGRARKQSAQSVNVFPTKRIQPTNQRSKEPLPDQYEALREAKAFIKSQRHRLHLDEGEGPKEALHQSERTESSGIGSLKRASISGSLSHSPRSPLNSRVAKDIDTILSSLKKLDGQMQSLWTMVVQGQGSEGQGFLKPLVHPAAPAALAQYNIMRDSGALESLQTNNWHPAITNADLRSRYTLTSGDPLTLPGIVPNSSLLNNLEFNQASKHFFEDELQTFEALQERIWKTYGPPQEEESVKAKAKDLRDWLHKF